MSKDRVAEDGLDHAARAGMMLAAVAVGRSYQPNLLTRNTMNQAVISGVSAATGYGWGVAGGSLLASVARRFTGGRTSVAGLTAVNATAVAAGVAGVKALAWKEHETGNRALARLGLVGLATAGGAGLVSAAVGRYGKGRYHSAAMWGVSLAAGTLSWLLPGPAGQAPGSEIAPGVFMEDDVKDVRPAMAAGIGVVVTGLTLVLAKGESALSRGFARGASVIMGGAPEDHRTIGRIGATVATYAAGWGAVTAVSAKLSQGGEGMEPAHSTPPQAPEVTGSPASGVPWTVLSREGRRWLSMALTPSGIDAVMQTSGAKQPIRVYAALQEASDPQQRAEALLAEIDRTRALERKVFVLFSPTGSGYVNYVASEVLEYLTAGDCASASLQYSVLPSALSLTKVGAGVQQTRMVLDGINIRLREMDPDARPRFFMFGESLGSQVSEDVFRGTGPFGPPGAGIESAIWIGTPAATEWRRELWGDRKISKPPQVGPSSFFLPRALPDWYRMPKEERAKVRYLLLQNGDDPIPKFGAEVLWRRPDWLITHDERPPGAPKRTHWTPVSTFFATFLDMLNALTPTPGVFVEGGHDYRQVLPGVISEVWGLPVSDERMARVQWALRVRERAWELSRKWSVAQQDTDPEAKQKVLELLSTWQGFPSDEEELHKVLEVGLEPTPGPGEVPTVSGIGPVPADGFGDSIGILTRESDTLAAPTTT